MGNMGTGTIDAWRLLMQIEGTPCLVAEVGRSQRINLDSVFGGGSENLTYYEEVTISDEDSEALGLLTPPVIKGMPISKQISVIARGIGNGNGGWL